MNLEDWLLEYGRGARQHLSRKLNLEPITIDRWRNRNDLSVQVFTSMGEVTKVRVTKTRDISAKG